MGRGKQAETGSGNSPYPGAGRRAGHRLRGSLPARAIAETALPPQPNLNIEQSLW
jgi:hypothetical protein